MKQPLPKRRRVSSNPLSLQPSSDVSASLKSSRISTCTSCRRTVGLKSSPAFHCARCGASTCAICLRTCTGDPVSSPCWAGSSNPPHHSMNLPLSQSNTNTPSPRRRRPRDEDSDSVWKAKDMDKQDNERSECGQVVCRTCCLEHPQSGVVACLDCSANQRATQAHDPNPSMHGALNLDYSLIASS